MKNLFVIAMMTLLSTTIFANTVNPLIDDSELSVETDETSTSIILKLTHLEKELTTIIVKDKDEQVIFSKEMEAEGDINLRLNLSKVRSGVYQLNVKRSGKSFFQDIQVNKDGSIAVGEMTTLVKPIFTRNEKGFLVTDPNAAVESVKIYDEKGFLIYAKKYNSAKKESANRVFNMSQVPKGDYTVILSTSDKSYDHELIVE